jgi:hypothetical protein
MGYYIFSYGIKTDQIKSTFGSKNQEILEKIRKNSVFKGYKDSFSEEYKTTPNKALEDIINGEKYDNSSKFAYGYAVIGMCATLGQVPPHTQEIKLGYETDLINRYLAESFNIKDLALEEIIFTDDTNPFDIPTPDDWPLVGFFSHAELVELKEMFKHINISDEELSDLEDGEDDDDEDKWCAYQHIKGFIENINFCIENDLDLISFCH